MSRSGNDSSALILETLKARLTPGRTLVLGLCGAQGSGKSTIAANLSAALSATGLVAPVLSLDDLYLSRRDRTALAGAVHPLLATRGPPGTHAVALGSKVLSGLENAGPTRLPRFDKGSDEPLPLADWPSVDGPADVVIFEGWCVGARPEAPDALITPINGLERSEDPTGVWRNWINDRLAIDYPSLFERLDMLVLLVAPDLATVVDWRAQQEDGLRARLMAKGAPLGATMGRAQIERFVQHYERLTRHVLREMPSRADLVVHLNRTRRPIRVERRGGARDGAPTDENRLIQDAAPPASERLEVAHDASR